jgi:hypothetical protein
MRTRALPRPDPHYMTSIWDQVRRYVAPAQTAGGRYAPVLRPPPHGCVEVRMVMAQTEKAGEGECYSLAEAADATQRLVRPAREAVTFATWSSAFLGRSS